MPTGPRRLSRRSTVAYEILQDHSCEWFLDQAVSCEVRNIRRGGLVSPNGSTDFSHGGIGTEPGYIRTLLEGEKPGEEGIMSGMPRLSGQAYVA